MLNSATVDNPPLTYIFTNQQEVFKTITSLITLIRASFVGVLLSCLATTKTTPKGTVMVDPHEVIEVSFLPTNSLYQKRCLTQLGMVYCADTGCMATVVADYENVEIDFIADAQ